MQSNPQNRHQQRRPKYVGSNNNQMDLNWIHISSISKQIKAWVYVGGKANPLLVLVIIIKA